MKRRRRHQLNHVHQQCTPKRTRPTETKLARLRVRATCRKRNTSSSRTCGTATQARRTTCNCTMGLTELKTTPAKTVGTQAHHQAPEKLKPSMPLRTQPYSNSQLAIVRVNALVSLASLIGPNHQCKPCNHMLRPFRQPLRLRNDLLFDILPA